MPVIRLESNGPAEHGLTPLELEPEDFQSDLPEQNWHIYHEDTELGLTVGVWTTTSMQEAFGPYPGDEFMCILEGKVSLIDADENEVKVNTRETFVVRNGIPISWKQEGFCRKFFMTYLSPHTQNSAKDSAEGSIKILRETELEQQFVPTENPTGVTQKDASAFTNDTGNMTAGMWETDGIDTPLIKFDVHEFAQILSGSGTIKEEDGTAHNFAAGDCFFIPAGTVCSWHSNAPFRKFYCSLSPSGNA